MIGRTLLVTASLAFSVVAAHAQERPALHAYGVFGDLRLSASQTFEAVAASAHTRTIGGGVQRTAVYRRIFVDVALSRVAVDGERVTVDGTTVYPLGIPLHVSMFSLDAAAGWRWPVRRRLSAYVGGGVSRLWYDETSEGPSTDENVSASGVGPLWLGGVDFRVSRFLVGGELRYRSVGGILGEGGASAHYQETSAGGTSVAVRVSVGLP